MADDVPDHSAGDGSTRSGDNHGVNVEIVLGPGINRRSQKRRLAGYRKTEALQPNDRSDRD
jgi:RNase P/RNase MRP subunit p30